MLIAHEVIRLLLHVGALQVEIDPDRLRFVHALRLIQAAIPEFQMATLEQLPRLHQRLLRDSGRKRAPERRLRINPRGVTWKMSTFKLKRPEHAYLLTLARAFREVAAVERAVRTELLEIAQSTDDELFLILPPSKRAHDLANRELRHREADPM